ncbi:MAG: Ig-like domain-containing protein [Chitinophagaceae bacterium]|nr:Ig-like domain-containing protein [Chitinophagaceae bacterium]
MKSKTLFILFPGIAFFYIIAILGSGCAQISAPTGGPRDSIPPQLLNASPGLKAVNVKSNKITFSFNEYIEVQDVQNNVLISPLPAKTPNINYKLKTVTVSLKDTLLPNTTYSINFGNAIKDVNEGNILQNFTYVFSTGNIIDSLMLDGKIIVAETGKTDSTIVALLYKNANDSAVYKRKPDYIARPDAGGNFSFNNLSAGKYKIYALKDGDGNKYYNSKTELFAFNNEEITVSSKNEPVTLYAFSEEKDNKNFSNAKTSPEKTLKYTYTDGKQDLSADFELTFNNPVKKLEPGKIILTDSAFTPIANSSIALDSTHKKVVIKTKWKQAAYYNLIINKDAVADSANNFLAKTDTLHFTAKSEADYGNVILRFTSLDITQKPVLQFIQNDVLKMSFSLLSNEWSMKLFPPGEYDIRILLDANSNGKWDAGNYSKKIQPERVIVISQKLSVRPDWDNETDIKL